MRKPFIIKLKIPKVRIMRGVDMNFSTGFTKRFKAPKTKPASTNPSMPLLITNPGTSRYANQSATEFEKSLKTKEAIGFLDSSR